MSNPPSAPARMPTFTVRKESGGTSVLKWIGIGGGILLALIVILGIIGAITSAGEDENSSPVSAVLPTLTFQEVQSEASQVTYDDLFRNNESYLGELVHYRGQVVQVVEAGGDDYRLRVNVTEGAYFWEDTVFLHYSGARLLEDDIVEFVGEVKGLITYEAVLGNQITIPEIQSVQTRLISKG